MLYKKVNIKENGENDAQTPCIRQKNLYNDKEGIKEYPILYSDGRSI